LKLSLNLLLFGVRALKAYADVTFLKYLFTSIVFANMQKLAFIKQLFKDFASSMVMLSFITIQLALPLALAFMQQLIFVLVGLRFAATLFAPLTIQQLKSLDCFESY
jgi:hypothetical protein